MSYSACLLWRKVVIETVWNFTSSDMITLLLPPWTQMRQWFPLRAQPRTQGGAQ